MPHRRSGCLVLLLACVSCWSSGGGAANRVAQTRPADARPPGPPVEDADTRGSGPCAGKRVGDVVAAVHARFPALADIGSPFVTPKVPLREGGERQHVEAFGDGGGFALVFHRGRGDCPEGCIAREFWYFRTDEACAPVAVGHFRIDPLGDCTEVEGAPMWETPPVSLDSPRICGGYNRPQDISGVYRVRAVGERTPCTAADEEEALAPVTLNLTVEVKQRWWPWRERGTVTVRGTGDPRIDGRALEARFSRRRFSAKGQNDDDAPPCDEGHHETEVSLDLESGAPGRLAFFESIARRCPSRKRCKGQMDLKLALE